MTRFLLTLLALLTGLTVSGGSAEARICGAGNEQVGLAEASADACLVAGHEASSISFAPSGAAIEPARHAIMVSDAAPVITVRLLADRARE